ncbi:hypothetical protein BN1012_Phect2207 [Candidatus Phaeomarinobacter ectocarpi]|uniref:DUF6969 domain-containing protein n=2 Tax=Candidatus Phaeomarinibacter ectocarpi TaxID=1458461 RepID=X5MMH0_9HYPH|nr:hypothetical protein BN1012_Phect2207 [Candidatus Phaeomarinobacter ectocarpi]
MTLTTPMAAPILDTPGDTRVDAPLTDELADAAFGLVDAGAQMAEQGLNPVTLTIGTFDDDAPFESWTHYPPGDARDSRSGVQIYYHGHRAGHEHGHFHIFLKAGDTASDVKSISAADEDATTLEADDLFHVIAITMDATGLPIELFTTNRWVTDEAMVTAKSILPLLDRLTCTDAFDAPLANQWFSHLFGLFRDDIAQLLVARDDALETINFALDDEAHEVLSSKPISILDRMEELGLFED